MLSAPVRRSARIELSIFVFVFSPVPSHIHSSRIFSRYIFWCLHHRSRHFLFLLFHTLSLFNQAKLKRFLQCTQRFYFCTSSRVRRWPVPGVSSRRGTMMGLNGGRINLLTLALLDTNGPSSKVHLPPTLERVLSIPCLLQQPCIPLEPDIIPPLGPALVTLHLLVLHILLAPDHHLRLIKEPAQDLLQLAPMIS